MTVLQNKMTGSCKKVNQPQFLPFHLNNCWFKRRNKTLCSNPAFRSNLHSLPLSSDTLSTWSCRAMGWKLILYLNLEDHNQISSCIFLWKINNYLSFVNSSQFIDNCKSQLMIRTLQRILHSWSPHERSGVWSILWGNQKQ